MSLKFNPPPGWPSPPAGWLPPAGWQPDPSWPAPPPGWPLWVEDTGPVPGTPIPSGPPPIPSGPPTTQPGPPPTQPAAWQTAAYQTAPPSPPAGAGRPRRRLGPWLAGGAGLVVLLLVVAGAIVYLNRGPSAPVAVASSAVDGNSVTISWVPGTDGPTVDRYSILRDGTEVGSVPGSQSTYTDDEGLSPAETYTYTVVAVSGSDLSEPSPETSVTPMAPSPSAVEAVEMTTTSVVLGWDPPASAPIPDRYVVLRNGETIATVEGSEPGFADTGLTPATAYDYAILAEWGSRASESSDAVVVETKTPTLSAARLVGSWPIKDTMTRTGGTWPKVGKTWGTLWDFTPKCDEGACGAVVSAQIMAGDAPFKVTLTREGTEYTGSTKLRYSYCRSTKIKDTVTIRIRVKEADLVDGEWVATGLKGTLKVLSPYTSVGGGWYCPTQTHTMTVTGSRS